MTSNSGQKILILEKDEAVAREIAQELSGRGLSTAMARGEYEALQLLSLETYDLVVMDENTSLLHPEETIRLIRKSKPDIPIILLLEPAERRMVKRETLLTGLLDYLPKPFSMRLLGDKVDTELSIEAVHKQVAQLRKRLEQDYGFANIIGNCRKMEEVFQAMEKIAESDVTVYIRGESGTGKELIAREIHRKSRRRNRVFIPINCAAIPDTLLESELFGHEKGAFTGATSQRKGKFELADGGTLFLDEIGDMSMILQAKILRILEEQEFERVGGSEALKVNVRIVTATNKDLLEEVQNGAFRKDLYYRINVYPIHLPPLRERAEDIPLLVSYFIEKLAAKNGKSVRTVTPGAMKILTEYSWPGNVRELENVLERAVLLASGHSLDESHFSLVPIEEDEPGCPEPASESHGGFAEPAHIVPSDESEILSLDEVEKRHLEHAMRVMGGNISRVAQKLKIGRSTLYRKLEKYNLIRNE